MNIELTTGKVSVYIKIPWSRKFYVCVSKHSKSVIDFDITFNCRLFYLNIDLNNKFLPF